MTGMFCEIGAQFYTVREHCKTLDSLDASMAKVAAIGYKSVQISGIGDFSAADIRATADKHGLSIVITHTNPDMIRHRTDEVIENHKTLGAGYIGIGSMPGHYRGSADGVRGFIADYAPAVEKIKAAGMKFMYHNHSFEFERYGGQSVFDLLIEGFDPQAVGFTLDTYWIAHGGGDPAAWLRKLRGRIDTIHFKDLAIAAGKQQMAEVMEGNLNWSAIFDACAESGVKWAFVEQDDCYGRDPFECLRTSLSNLMKARRSYSHM
jgi:sugar phosphate isomerase/epimerase